MLKIVSEVAERGSWEHPSTATGLLAVDDGPPSLPGLLLRLFDADGAAVAIRSADAEEMTFVAGAGRLAGVDSFQSLASEVDDRRSSAGERLDVVRWRSSQGPSGQWSVMSVPLERGARRRSAVAVLLHDDPAAIGGAWPGHPAHPTQSLLLEALRSCACAFAAEEERRALAAALDQFDAAVFLFDPSGGLTVANGAAADLLDRGTVLRRSGAKLVAATIADTVKLQASIQALAAAPPAECEAAVFRLGSDETRLVAAVNRLDGESAHSPAPTVMLLCLQPDAENAAALERICRLYGLSPSETRLALRLVRGESVAEASAALHIKAETARAYLKHIFVKTGAKRQADLVRVLLRSVAGWRDGTRATPI